MNKLKTLIIAFIAALALQFFNLGIIEGSILGNLPILGEFLTFFDAIATIKYLKDGVTTETTIPLFFRVLSLTATIYTVAFLHELKVPSSIKNEPLYNILIIAIMIVINIMYTLLIRSICLPIFKLANETAQLLRSLPIE